MMMMMMTMIMMRMMMTILICSSVKMHRTVPSNRKNDESERVQREIDIDDEDEYISKTSDQRRLAITHFSIPIPKKNDENKSFPFFICKPF